MLEAYLKYDWNILEAYLTYKLETYLKSTWTLLKDNNNPNWILLKAWVRLIQAYLQTTWCLIKAYFKPSWNLQAFKSLS